MRFTCNAFYHSPPTPHPTAITSNHQGSPHPTSPPPPHHHHVYTHTHTHILVHTYAHTHAQTPFSPPDPSTTRNQLGVHGDPTSLSRPLPPTAFLLHTRRHPTPPAFPHSNLPLIQVACASHLWYLLYLVFGFLFGILLMVYGKRASIHLHLSIEVKDVGIQADRTNYDGMTVMGLQSELRYRGMEVTGLKEELVKRCSNNTQ
jgi:hypothetical protein